MSRPSSRGTNKTEYGSDQVGVEELSTPNGALPAQGTQLRPPSSRRRPSGSSTPGEIIAQARNEVNTPPSARLPPKPRPGAGGLPSLPSTRGSSQSLNVRPPVPPPPPRDPGAAGSGRWRSGSGAVKGTIAQGGGEEARSVATEGVDMASNPDWQNPEPMGGTSGLSTKSILAAVYGPLAHSVIRKEVAQAVREEADSYIRSITIEDDGLSWIEHIWLDTTTEALQELVKEVLMDCFQELSQEYIRNEWSERILDQYLQELVVPEAARVAQKTLSQEEMSFEADRMVEEEVKETVKEVARLCFSEAQAVDSDMLEDEDYALVNVESSEQIMNSIIFKHMLGLVASRGGLWAFQEFAEGDFANSLFAEAMLRHIRIIQDQILDKPYYGRLRAELTSEVATNHLIQQLQAIGSETPDVAAAAMSGGGKAELAGA